MMSTASQEVSVELSEIRIVQSDAPWEIAAPVVPISWSS